MSSWTSGLRAFFAQIDMFLADMIVNVYSLILSLADVKIMEKLESVVDKMYMLIGLFMAFKMAIVVINYIVDPDKLTDAKVGTQKFIVRIVISLALLASMTNIFSALYRIQAVILKENVIGKFVLGNKASNVKKVQEEKLKEVAKSVSYSLVTSFLNYNASGELGMVFSGCPNIFKAPDEGGVYIEVELCGVSMRVRKCIDYLTGLYYDTTSFGKNNDNSSGYYYCKNTSDLERSHYCGVREGEALIKIINEARDKNDYKAVLSSEILTATENDPLFSSSATKQAVPDECCHQSAQDIINSGTEAKITKCHKSGGDFVFEYIFGISSIALLITLIMFIILCVDVAIRVVKFVFLEVISPIAVVSYIDVKESALFNKWVKLTINTYLELFLKLFVIYMVTYFLSGKLNKVSSGNPMVLIFLIIGLIIFAIKCPDFISKMLGLSGDGGVMSLLKNTGKFIVGASTMAVAGVGGNLANTVAAIQNGAPDGNKGKAIIKGIGSGIAGGFSASAGAAKRILANNGNVAKGTISKSIRESSLKRNMRKFGISSDDIENSEKIQENLDKKHEEIEKQNSLINQQLISNPNRLEIEEAFKTDDDYNLVYKNYVDYQKEMLAQGKRAIEEAEYKQYEKMYENLRNLEQEYADLKRKLEYSNFRQKNQ